MAHEHLILSCSANLSKEVELPDKYYPFYFIAETTSSVVRILPILGNMVFTT
jgi:hypothetical protein